MVGLTVGIPRALLYYRFYPAWEVFFKQLGFTIILSDQTNEYILERGLKLCTNEACLPIKVYFGHIDNLKDRVDYVFVPRMVSIKQHEFFCPKIIGLPDMIRNSFGCKFRMIDPVIDHSRNNRKVLLNIYRMASCYKLNPLRVAKAIHAAWKEYFLYRRSLNNHTMTPVQVIKKRQEIICKYGISKWREWALNEKKLKTNHGLLRVAVLGNDYNLYDNYINFSLFSNLRKSGAEILTADRLTSENISCNISRLPGGMFWTMSKDILGSAYHFLLEKQIDGLIYIASFGCGPDSVVAEMVGLEYKQDFNYPFMLITLDEHSGETGLCTRIEAFMDMLRFKLFKAVVKE